MGSFSVCISVQVVIWCEVTWCEIELTFVPPRMIYNLDDEGNKCNIFMPGDTTLLNIYVISTNNIQK